MKIEVWGSGEYLRAAASYIGQWVSSRPELLVCLAHPKILKKEDWAHYKYGAINFHCGLPNYRGRHPLQWMLIDGVEQIPVSVHYIDEGIDTGNILVHGYVGVDLNETYETALEKVCSRVGPMMNTAIRRVYEGDKGQPQPEGRYVRKRTPEDSRRPISLPSLEAHRLINAMSDPMPNANWAGVTYKKSVIKDGFQIVECAYRIST